MCVLEVSQRMLYLPGKKGLTVLPQVGKKRRIAPRHFLNLDI